ncbi:MAG: hypothetical protein LQ340_001824 [Diploschistes diacapsis]|nr:MAG: hypothetical protein LQ340_001824 [Diploschistes diacapsis]
MDIQQILFIDAFDSFSNNIIALLEKELQVNVTKIHIDEYLTSFFKLSRNFSAIVIGPGPGSADNPHDVGVIEQVWKLSDEYLLPVMGICLGFQSLVRAFGGKIETLPHPRHGQKTTITTQGASIFEGLEAFEAVQYHSLYAILGNEICRGDANVEQRIWESGPLATDLIPLAWDLQPYGYSEELNNEQTRLCRCESHPERILMAVKHAHKPFYGVQFHPESICSSNAARQVVRNWWHVARGWPVQSTKAVNQPLSQNKTGCVPAPNHSQLAINMRLASDAPRSLPFAWNDQVHSSENVALKYQSMQLGKLTVPSICSRLEIVGRENQQAVILDSAKKVPSLGAQSIIGIVDANTLIVSYRIGSAVMELRKGQEINYEDLGLYENSVFEYMKQFMRRNELKDLSVPSESSFWGGFMGYIDYEACLETIAVDATFAHSKRPNISFAFVEKSIVLAQDTELLYVQSIRRGDSEWVQQTMQTLKTFQQEIWLEARAGLPSKEPVNSPATTKVKLRVPVQSEYCDKIRICQKELKAGNSYELCLTDQTEVEVPVSEAVPSWKQYQSLRKCNPAPFAAYLRLGPLTLMSSSPERFLHWSRPKQAKSGKARFEVLESICQFRPIKGTVEKQIRLHNGQIRRRSLEEATSILSTPKEQAENLMIVDLIRHDLTGVVGANNVHVPYLMSVEEYETVYQLVTVVEGSLYQLRPSTLLGICEPGSARRVDPYVFFKSGLDVLRASLPPGSMTGAPKKRSCEILNKVELGKPRSVYSGVLGYIDVGGRGDFSVIIRTVFKWEDEQPKGGGETWRIGAGGAVTALSTEEGEWNEMNTKLSSVLGIYE